MVPSLVSQVTQNEFFRFCLKLNSRQHIEDKEFKEINWLLTKERVKQHVAIGCFQILEGDFTILCK